MVVRPDEALVSRDYLRHVLSGGIDMSAAISGTAQPQITRTSLTPLLIPLPPLDEQRRMVATLDEAALAVDRGQSAATEELELADAMASALMTELLTAA